MPQQSEVSPDAREMAAWMRTLAEIPIKDAPFPDARYVWWKGQMLRQWDIDRRVVRPIEIGEHALSVVGLAVALILLRTLWPEAVWVGSTIATEAAHLRSAAVVVTGMFLMAIVIFVGRSIVPWLGNHGGR